MRVLAAIVVWFVLTTGPVFAQTFTVSRVDFDESAYLSEAELQAIAADYTGRPVTLPQLQKMVARVQALYSEAGIVTAQAVIPPQTLKGGVLTINLVEARISEVRVEGPGKTRPSFMRRNLSLKVGARPDFVRLERDLRVFDLAHDVSPQIGFAPGEEVGTTVATISGDAPDRYTFGVSLDNYGREETGEARLTAFAIGRNMTGVRDTLTGQVTVTEGSTSGSLGYSRPVGPGGGRVVGSLSYSQADIIGGTFSPIQIETDTQAATLAYRRPVRVRPFSHVIIEGGLVYERSESTVGGRAFSDVDIAEAYVQARYARRLENAAFGGALGLRFGDANAEGTTQTEGSYTLLYGDASYARPLGDALVFDANLRFQIAPDVNLPVARLFSIGGVGSVRGYPNDLRSGDSGVTLNLQLTKADPIDTFGGRVEITPFGFADIGAAVPFRAVDKGFDGDRDLLASVGAGARFGFDGRDVQAVALMGVPLKDTEGFDDTGDPRFYVGLDWRF